MPPLITCTNLRRRAGPCPRTVETPLAVGLSHVGSKMDPPAQHEAAGIKADDGVDLLAGSTAAGVASFTSFWFRAVKPDAGST
ncbi:hypothetical protein OG946_13765 [Streptomyces sp. NBC_01808]|uniref:hypothetical protein n=1 Tax=Streptomyces sp. NBC_01808 TaxID=2975947 RepID=UPI002DD807CB|nr:hypothetical protein [Streptomyces sp. NBC_01808]WSA38346.1 hypothetical protein OG946_13765 [Streptomyces sp. NBC_01808]